MSGEMYVVVEFNQAGGPPVIPEFAEVFETVEGARVDKFYGEQAALNSGRRDTYRIATLTIEDQNDD